MKRKTILMVGATLGVIFCCAIVAVWGVYSLLNNPDVKKGFSMVGEELSAMLDLRGKVLQEYPCEDVGVEIQNGTTLNVSLVNSEFNDMSYSQQEEKAHQVAQFVKDHYTGKANFTHIVITFVRNSKTGPLNAFQSSSFPFEVSDLK